MLLGRLTSTAALAIIQATVRISLTAGGVGHDLPCLAPTTALRGVNGHQFERDTGKHYLVDLLLGDIQPFLVTARKRDGVQ